MTKLDADLIKPLPASDLGSAAVWGSKRINTRSQSCLCLTWSGYPSNDDDDTRLIDNVLNDVLRIVTGYLRPTPTEHLPILLSIQPAELRRSEATLSWAFREFLDPGNMLHGILNGFSDTGQERLRSRRPFVPVARNLLNNLVGLSIRASLS